MPSTPKPLVGGDGAEIECGACDVSQVPAVAHSLLLGTVKAAIARTTGDLFRYPKDVFEDVKKDLLAFLFKSVGTCGPCDENQEPVKLVDAAIADFISGSKSIFSRMQSIVLPTDPNVDEKVQKLLKEVEGEELWPLSEQESIARMLIRDMDKQGKFHCTVKFVSNGELKQQRDSHEPVCDFRKYSCANLGCEMSVSALHAEEHDKICPYKLLPCVQECEMSIPRREMARHCNTVCSFRVVPCPFSMAGCPLSLLQKDVPSHCQGAMESHLYLLLQTHAKQQEMLAASEKRIALLEQAVCLAEKKEILEVKELKLQLQGSEGRVKSLESELTKVRREVRGVDCSRDVRQIQRELKAMQAKSPPR
eukprot:TRINITY_DN2078_c0_g1_i1.p1 TRINITY_DN2078_c0_g1~~TRINITY_DN2078_c0_g1_i1.p1  ORF type:complete len:364 (-),score=92.18 TRINITY_DN2078_c0_g1_i1:169-1260(-)